MKKIIFLIVLTIMLFATLSYAQDKWTWMLYLLEDGTGLDGMDDLNEWESNGSTSDVNYLVLIDADDDTKDGIYYIQQDPNGYDSTFRSPRVSTSFGTDPDMSDWQTLRDYMIWCKDNYPADHYGLILWDHGDGIFKGEVTHGIFGSTVADNSSSEDKDFVDGMKLWELDDALSSFDSSIGRNIDIVGFDVCLLGQIETVYQLKDLTDYVIASEKTEPGDGWDYVAPFSKLNTTPTMSASTIATHIVNDYVASYNGGSQGSQTVTQACTSTALLKSDLIPALDNFAEQLRSGVYTNESDVKDARNNAWNSTYNTDHKDLGDFAKLIKDNTSLPTALRDAAQDVLDAIGVAVIAEGSTNLSNKPTGLKIWMTEDIESEANETYYVDATNYLTFSNTKWDEYLYNYKNPQPYNNDFPPVQNLTATVGNATVTLNWDAPAKNTLDHYRVDRNGTTIANNIPAGTTTYTDNSVTNETTYTYDVYAVYTGSPAGDSNKQSVSATPYAPKTLPYTQNFDSFPDGITSGTIYDHWTNASGDDGDWTVNTGSTPSSSTGPSADHTSGSGKYLYTEASSNESPGYPSKTAYLLTPMLDFSGVSTPTIDFWYHLYGADMGTLYLDTWDGSNWTNVWSLSGDQGNSWKQASVILSSSVTQIRFRALTGSNYTSDMAIDDVYIHSGSPADFSLSPTSLAYGDVEVGTTKVLQFTISNNGSGTITGDITTPSGYSVATSTKGTKGRNTLSYSITTSQTFNLTFAPSQENTYNGTVTITCNEDTPTNLSVTGTGIAAKLVTNPNSSTGFSKNMIIDETATENLKLSNTGSATLNYTASVQYSKGRSTINVYPFNTNYATGSTTSSSKTQTSLIKGYDTEDGWMKFDISAIPDGSVINSVVFHGYVNYTYYPYWSITPLSNDPVTADASTLSADITAEEDSGYYLHQDEGSDYSTGWKEYTLEGNITTDLHNALAQDWFAIGISSRDNSTSYYIYFDGWNEANKPYLEIDYTPSYTWLTINGSNTASGNISINMFDNLTVGFDASGMTTGTYNANIQIASNDPNSPYNIPVTFIVENSADNTADASNNNGDGSTSADVDVPKVTINGDTIDPDISVDPDGNLPIVVDVSASDSAQHSGLTANVLLSYEIDITGNTSGNSMNFTLSYSGLSTTPQSLLWWNATNSQWEAVSSPQWDSPSANHVNFNLVIPNTKDGSTEFILSNDNSPLPVVFGYFNSTYGNGTALLQWVTVSEENSNYWNVYKGLSSNFGQSKKLNNIPIEATNSSTEENHYTYMDNSNFEDNTTYYYWVENISLSGQSSVFGPFELNIEDGNHNETPNIIVYGLHQNYPNPFNPNTKISFALKQNSKVNLVIYNSKGQKVKTIYQNKYIEKDKVIDAIWNGKDDNGRNVSSGLYFYKLKTNDKTYIKKMLLLK
jgi:hypothetical protein